MNISIWILVIIIVIYYNSKRKKAAPSARQARSAEPRASQVSAAGPRASQVSAAGPQASGSPVMRQGRQVKAGGDQAKQAKLKRRLQQRYRTVPGNPQNMQSVRQEYGHDIMARARKNVDEHFSKDVDDVHKRSDSVVAGAAKAQETAGGRGTVKASDILYPRAIKFSRSIGARGHIRAIHLANLNTREYRDARDVAYGTLMQEVEDILAMGYQYRPSYERDFIGEAEDMLNSYMVGNNDTCE